MTSSDDERYPRIDHSSSASRRGRHEVEVQPTEVPLGLVLLRNLWTATKGTLTLDIARPTIPRRVAARHSLLTFRKRQQQDDAAQAAPSTRLGGHQFVASRPGPRRGYVEEPLPVVPFMDTGARLKVMRHVELGPTFEGVKGTGDKKSFPAMDIGAGFNFELDTAELKPQARIKLWDFLSLRALPRPSLKLSKRLAISEEAGWGVRLSYECPLDNLDRFWEPPSRLLVSLDNLGSSGLRLTQSGVEFSGSVSFSDGNLMIRGAGHVDFPHQVPVEVGEPLVRYELRRLGLKANW